MDETDMDTDVQLKQLFGACDRKGKGFVVKEELEELCLSLGISGEDSDAIFTDLDLDNDGQVTFSDFSFGFREFLNPENEEESQVQLPVRRRASMWTFSSELSKDRNNKSQEDDSDNNDASSDGSCLLDINAYTELRKRESLYHAWTHFTSSLVECNLLSLSPESQLQIRKLYKDLEGRNFPSAIASQVDSAVTSLIKEMGKLQMKNKTLEELYNKEKTTHVKTLMTLEEEMEDQVARVEERAKERANIEKEEEKRQLQEQMDIEVAEMQAHLKIFQKVDSWLKNDHVSDDIQETKKKLAESNVANRGLRLALDDTTSNLAVFRSDLAYCRLQYEEKCRELHQEREQVLEYMHQYDHVRRQLDLIHEANKRLQDTNDSLRQYLEFDLRSPSVSRTSSQRSFVNRNAKESLSLSPIPLSSAVMEGESNKANSGLRSQLEESDSGLSTLVGKTKNAFYGAETAQYSSTNGPPSLEDELRNLPEITVDENCLDSDNIERLEIFPPPPDRLFQSRSITPKEEETSQRNSLNYENHFTPDRTYKVVLAGDAAVGKSTFIARICKGEFVPHLSATLGVDYKVKTMKIDDKNTVIQLWDTAGQERFRAITKCYFRRADGVLLLYDVTNEKSFKNVRTWVQDVNESCVSKIPLILCGNKADLRENRIKQKNTAVVTSFAGERIALENGAKFYETSTKNGDNIMEAFIELARQMAACEDLAIQTSALRLISNGKKKSRCCSSGKKL